MSSGSVFWLGLLKGFDGSVNLVKWWANFSEFSSFFISDMKLNWNEALDFEETIK